MSELSREEALVAAAVLAVINRNTIMPRVDSVLPDVRAALSREEIRTALAGGGGKIGRGDDGTTCRTGTGGGGGEKVERPACIGLRQWPHESLEDYDARSAYIASLESRLAAAEKANAQAYENGRNNVLSKLAAAEHEVEAAKRSERVVLSDNDELARKLAAAEKRAEEARDAFTLVVGECDALKAELAHLREVRLTTICPFCDQNVCSLGIEDDQRGAVQSHILACPKHPMRSLEYRLGEAARERDAALARVKELEAAGTLTSSSGESGGVTYWFEKYAAAKKALATIRDAAGAQP